MRPLTLHLTNWMPFAEEKLDLAAVHVAALTGENGAGKSSILDAMTWALWGKARGDSDEERIRAGAQQCAVKLAFEVNGRRFQVVRTKRRGKGKSSGQSTLTLFDGQEDITGATMKETQAAIVDLIRMDYQTFCNSVFLRQGHADEFTVADPADRKRVLISILGLDQYDSLETLAKARLRETEDGILAQTAKGDQVTAEASGLDAYGLLLQEAQAKMQPITAAVEKREAAVRDLEAQTAQLQPKTEELGRTQKERAMASVNLNKARELRDTLADMVAKYRGTIEKKPDILRGYQEMQDAEKARLELSEKARVFGEVNKKRGELALTISQAEAKVRKALAEADTLIKSLSSARPELCPTCGQTMNPEKQAEIAGRLGKAQGARDSLKERLSSKSYAVPEQQELARLDAKAAELGESIKEWDKVQADVKRLDPFGKLYHQLQEAETNLERSSGHLKEAEASVKTCEDTLAAADQRIKDLTSAVSGAGEIARKLAAARTDLANAKLEHGTTQKAVADLTAKMDFARECQEQAQEIEAQLQQLRRQADVYRFLAGAFNKAGIPSEIIKAAVPELEAEANAFLSDMTEGRMSLALLTQRDNKSGTTTETLDILISDELGTRAYEMYSGGEAFKVNLALRLALSKMVARRAGAPTSCLFIDEGFGTQDQNGLTKVVEALHSVEDKFKLVLVITHLDELREEFGTQIRVTKDGAGSKVAVL